MSTEGGESPNAFVDHTIQSHKLVVFSKTYCPYSAKAKNTLKKYNVADMATVELDERDDCEQVLDYLNKLTGAKTVPRVFINGSFIGGGDDTVRLDESGRMRIMLEECGAIGKEQ